MELDILLTLSQQGNVFASPRRIALLRQIQATGSISQGANQARISYKAAWDAPVQGAGDGLAGAGRSA